MNAPLIVVQGDLLVPTLFPMASMPYAAYGEEWTLHAARPALTEYEIPFYTARFLTAYISRLAPSNDRFPYTPASLWGNFRRNDEMMLVGPSVAESTVPVHAPQFVQPPEPVPVVAPTVPPVEPAPAAFESFVDDEPPHVPPAPPSNDRRKQYAGGAIALACAAFIAWALFGTKSGHHGEPARPSQVAANPPAAAIKNEKRDDETASTAGTTAESAASASAVAVTVASTPAPAAAIAVAPALPSPSTVSSGVSRKPEMIVSSTNSGRVEPAARAPLETRATRETVRATPLVHTKAHLSARQRRELHRYEHNHHRHGYRAEPVYRSADGGSQLASPYRRNLAHPEYRSGSASNASPNIPEMYRMLAHSAVLDDNSSLRAAPRLPSAPRASSGEGSNYNVDLNQRRLTDAP